MIDMFVDGIVLVSKCGMSMPAIMTRHLGNRTAAKLFRAGYSFCRNDGPTYFVETPNGSREMMLGELFDIADAL